MLSEILHPVCRNGGQCHLGGLSECRGCCDRPFIGSWPERTTSRRPFAGCTCTPSRGTLRRRRANPCHSPPSPRATDRQRAQFRRAFAREFGRPPSLLRGARSPNFATRLPGDVLQQWEVVGLVSAGPFTSGNARRIRALSGSGIYWPCGLYIASRASARASTDVGKPARAAALKP